MSSSLIKLAARIIFDVDSKVLREISDENGGGDTVICPMIASMEVIIVCHSEHLLLQCLRDAEAFTTFAAGEVYKTFSLTEAEAFGKVLVVIFL